MYRLQVFSVIPILYLLENLGKNEAALRMITPSVCGCLGEILTYECTVFGGLSGATVWTGTPLNCPSNEIVLFHQSFTESNGITRNCNNRATVAQSLYVQNNLYTSQLNITITQDIHEAGKMIMCGYDDMMGDGTSQFSTQIPGLLPSPINLHISTANFIAREITFIWSLVAPDCPTIHYNILASNCGSCPTTTNHTTATCTAIPTDGSMCTFALRIIACGNISDHISNAINVTTTTLPSTSAGEDIGKVIPPILLGILLMLWVAVSALIIIVLIKGKIKIKRELEQARGQSKITITNSPHRRSTPRDIDTTDNVAYGMHTLY